MSKYFLTILMTVVVIGMSVFIPSAFASHCFDAQTGSYETLQHTASGDCPSGTDDPGASSSFSDDESGQITTFGGLLNQINSLLNAIVPVLVGLGVFVIIYGVFGYIQHSADEEKRDEAKKFIVWGVVGVFIMVSIWGFVNILINSFDLKKTPVQVESVFPTGLYE
ncbi:MAG: hypothetical protein Q7R64_00690 [bacterium]|nr:hypothetical protein [bacterium]